jgi:LmbE family N-acetylglucosaminyl deacetylase
MSTTRRTFAKNALSASAAFSLPSFVKAAKKPAPKKLKIVCVGGHPDDPESGCGGTLAKLAAAGHYVTIIYLTSGEAGIDGKSHAEAAAIRTGEAIAACKILNAKPVFAGQIDGAGIVDNEWIGKLLALIEAEKPDVAFTHWPVDSHKDHQCASLLAIQCWVRSGKIFELYFFEVCTGAQTMGFKPTDYVDITDTKEQKRKAVFCHASQNPPGIYAASDCNHGIMETFRGIEINVPAAEAFVRMGTGLNF